MDAGTSVGVAHRDVSFAESALDCALVGVQVCGDLGCGPAVFVEACGFVDLFGEQAGSAHGYVVASEDPADCLAVDSELVGEFVHGRAGLVAGDELLDLIVAELPGTLGPAWRGRRWLGCVGAGGLVTVVWPGRDFWAFDEERRVRIVPR